MNDRLSTLDRLIAALEAGEEVKPLSQEGRMYGRIQRAARPGTTDWVTQTRKVRGQLAQVVEAFGTYDPATGEGTGVTLKYGGRGNPANPMSTPRFQQGESSKQNYVTIFDSAFRFTSWNGWASTMTHEMAHRVLGLSDLVPGHLSGPKNQLNWREYDRVEYTAVYDWTGIKIGWDKNIEIADTFACAVAGGC